LSAASLARDTETFALVPIALVPILPTFAGI
jgi:hypothetical protein